MSRANGSLKKPPSNPSSQENRLLLIRQRVNQLASKFKKAKASTSLPHSPGPKKSSQDYDESEFKVRTPPKKHSPQRFQQSKMKNFLSSLGLSSYMQVFEENQISYEDLPLLSKDDLADMGIPIGPRNRILHNLTSQPTLQESPKEKLKDEVDRFISELSLLSRRSEAKRPFSSQDSVDFESQRTLDSITQTLKDITEKQNIMMKAIQDNQRAIAQLSQTRSASPLSKSPTNRSFSSLKTSNRSVLSSINR